MNTASPPSPFGQQLNYWRRQRGYSQLELATVANLSQRYVSFIETGRSRPREGVVLRIAEALDLPLRDRNSLLLAAGLNPRFPELPISDDTVAPFRAAIKHMLDTHEPYPAFVIDRWWNVVDANAAGWRFFPSPDNQVINAVDTFLAHGPVRDMIENFDTVAWTFVQRLQHEVAASGPDPRLQSLLDRAHSYLQDIPPPDWSQNPGPELVICPRLRIGDQVISTLSMIARFGNSREVNLEELRVELVYPADADADALFRTMAQT